MAQSQSPASEAQLHFLRGKKLVETNCTDCEGGTQAGMEQAINELLNAIRGGFSKQVAAYKLLSDAYADMATYVEKADPKKSKEYWSKQEDVKRKLYELDPKDPEIKADYINILKTDDEKIPLLRKTLESDPGSPATAGASYQLGIILIRKNQLTEGLNLAANGVNKEFAPNGVRTEAAELMHVLDERGCPLQNEAELSKELDDAFAKAMQGSDEDGDPVAMSGFKQDFLNAIKKHECKAQR